MLLYLNNYLQYSQDVYPHPEYNDIIYKKNQQRKIISTIIRSNWSFNSFTSPSYLDRDSTEH